MNLFGAGLAVAWSGLVVLLAPLPGHETALLSGMVRLSIRRAVIDTKSFVCLLLFKMAYGSIQRQFFIYQPTRLLCLLFSWGDNIT
jgi:hypothetical protein